MSFEPDKINKVHVLKAVKKIESENLELIDSTKFDVIINGKIYPPKEIMRCAHEEMNGEYIWYYGGGHQTNKYLVKMGFTIVEKNSKEGEMFKWVILYKELAKKLLELKDDHNELLQILIELKEANLMCISLKDKNSSGDVVPLDDIDPFTFFANFNRGITNDNRTEVLKYLKEKFKLDAEVPSNYGGVPVVNNTSTWFFGYKQNRGSDDINLLWQIFEQAVNADIDSIDEELFNNCLKIKGVKKNLTMGLFWINPENFIPLDQNSEKYLKKNYDFIETDISKLKYSGYKRVIQDLKEKANIPFYEISMNAWNSSNNSNEVIIDEVFLLELFKWEKYKRFKEEKLKQKILREEKAWELLESNKGKLTSEILSQFMDIVDDDNGKAGWFGLMLNGSNKNKILNNPEHIINDWVNTLIFSELKNEKAINKSLQKIKLNGAGYGFATLLLYLSNPDEFNIYIPGIARKAFKRLTEGKLHNLKENTEDYYLFNDGALFIKERYRLYPQELDWIFSHVEEFNKILSNSPKGVKPTTYNLNTILYGPPGTGKTYSTKDLALNALGINTSGLFRDEIIDLYNEYKDKGQIEFITFHQSFGYEDFVEGIKPVIEKNNERDEKHSELKYEIADGVFKNLCEKAKVSKLQSNKVSDFFINKSKFENVSYYKMSLGNTSVENENAIYEYCIKNGVIGLGWGDDLDFTNVNSIEEIKSVYSKANFNIENGYDFRVNSIKMFLLWMKEGDIVFISNGNKSLRAVGKITSSYKYIPDSSIPYCQFREVEWLLTDIDIPVKSFYFKNFSQQAIYQMNADQIDVSLFTNSTRKKIPDNFVLIIDEINRGNIASIFGELITLIESDKRTGEREELSAILPYSKESFSIPNNLYVIGTMNTADRSVEALDTALRRRFSFREVQPDYKLIAPAHLIVEMWYKYEDCGWDEKNFRFMADQLYSFLGFDDSDTEEELNESLPEINLPEKIDEVFKNVSFSGIKPDKLLESINKKLEVLLDKDHCIGHSYFLKLIDSSDPFLTLQNIFRENIIPLLQEYFYGDPAKIGLILGDGFVKQKGTSNIKFFTQFNSDYEDVDDKAVYEIVIPSYIDEFKKIYE